MKDQSMGMPQVCRRRCWTRVDELGRSARAADGAGPEKTNAGHAPGQSRACRGLEPGHETSGGAGLAWAIEDGVCWTWQKHVVLSRTWGTGAPDWHRQIWSRPGVPD